MAQQGFDPHFGLRGTSLARVSGWGGWPLSVVVGIDGRPTMICAAPDQTPMDRGKNPFVNPPVNTIRIVSVPPDGRPIGLRMHHEAVFGPDADGLEAMVPLRAISRKDRIAVLASVIRSNRQLPAILVFAAGPPLVDGVATWSLDHRFPISWPDIIPAKCGLGWANPEGNVMVVAPRRIGLGSRQTLQLLLFMDNGSQTREVRVPYPAGIDLPSGLDVQLAVGAVLRHVREGFPEGFLVGLTWEGNHQSPPFQLVGNINQGRASVLRLNHDPTAPQDADYRPDSRFGTDGLWIASESDGEITTADQGAIGPDALVIAGRARRAGTKSLFAAFLDPSSGAVTGSAYIAAGLLERPTGIAIDEGGRVIICGGTAEVDQNAASDTSQAVLVRLRADGAPDASFGQSGIAGFRLHGGTHPSAITVSASGNVLVASAVGWGWAAPTYAFHACLSTITPAGSLDPAFGLPGMARYDGVGDISIAATDPAGKVWSAGVALSPLSLRVSQVTIKGSLASGFGTYSIAAPQLGGLLPRGAQLADVRSLVPLADGRAIIGGGYYSLVPDALGTWILRLTASGELDPKFGTNGVLTLPARPNIRLISELADGSLQGFEDAPSGLALLRLTPDGAAASLGGRRSGVVAIQAAITLPRKFEASGEWFALVDGPLVDTSRTIGLMRWRSDGLVDTEFGAGNANAQVSAFVNIADTGKYGATPFRLPSAETLRLPDGTYLTIYSLGWQVDVQVIGWSKKFSWYPPGLLLIAWDKDGIPRSVPSWGGKAVRAIPNPVNPFVYLGWRPRCAALQPDGSILVGLQGDDLESSPSFGQPPNDDVRQTSYFCRLIPPSFALDPGFGNNKCVTQRLPGEKDQYPVSVQIVKRSKVVVAAIALNDGSIGVAHLI